MDVNREIADVKKEIAKVATKISSKEQRIDAINQGASCGSTELAELKALLLLLQQEKNSLQGQLKELLKLLTSQGKLAPMSHSFCR